MDTPIERSPIDARCPPGGAARERHGTWRQAWHTALLRILADMACRLR